MQLIECGKMFSVVDPTKLDVGLDSAVALVSNEPIDVANAAATVAESRKRK